MEPTSLGAPAAGVSAGLGGGGGHLRLGCRGVQVPAERAAPLGGVAPGRRPVGGRAVPGGPAPRKRSGRLLGSELCGGKAKDGGWRGGELAAGSRGDLARSAAGRQSTP